MQATRESVAGENLAESEIMATRNKMSAGVKWGIGITIFVVALAVFLLNTIWVTFGHMMARMFVGAPIIWLSILVGIVALIVTLVAFDAWDDYQPSKWSKPVAICGAVITVIAFFGLIFGVFATSYLNASATYNASTVKHEKTAESLSFNERVPFDVASAVSDRMLGDTTGQANGIIKGIAGSGDWTTMLIRKGVAQGYETVQSMQLPMFGSFDVKNDVTFCKFDKEKAGLRVGGGWFSNSMSMNAYREAGSNPLHRIYPTDVFAICDGETPMVYLPVTKKEAHGFVAYDVPAGVVTYNGKTGEMQFHEDLKLAGTSVYPQSIANAQLHSVRASGSYADYFFGRVGYETTSQSDSEDVNASNNGNFSLAIAGTTQAQYVTPITPRGSSSSVVGLAQMSSDSVKKGKMNTLVINKYGTSRQAPSTVASNVISGVLSGYKSSGLETFEVIPSLDGNWTVSIGKSQNILYRVVINSDGEATLFSAPDATTDKDDEGGSSEVLTPAGDKKVADMTNDELRALADSILSELAERASAAE